MKLELNNATLYHADCADIFDEIGKVDVVITDPPYGINIVRSGKIGEIKTPRMGKKKLMPYLVNDYGPQLWDKKVDKDYIENIILYSKN